MLPVVSNKKLMKNLRRKIEVQGTLKHSNKSLGPRKEDAKALGRVEKFLAFHLWFTLNLQAGKKDEGSCKLSVGAVGDLSI